MIVIHDQEAMISRRESPPAGIVIVILNGSLWVWLSIRLGRLVQASEHDTGAARSLCGPTAAAKAKNKYAALASLISAQSGFTLAFF